MAHIFTPALRRPLSKPFSRSGTRTLIQRAISSLRARGTDAHLWLPNTSNYLESTGQTVTTVGNPVGLVLDTQGSVSTLSTTGWVKSVGDGVVTVVGNTITITGATTTTRVNPVSFRTMRAGLTKVTALYTGSAVSPLIYSAGTPVAPVSGISATSLYQSTNSQLDCVQIGSGDAVFVIQEYTEITGIHLTQATTANKPILQKTDSKYSWTFDGSNDSLGTTFTAGTLTSNMDCFVVMSRATDANGGIACYDGVSNAFGVYKAADESTNNANCGTPRAYVDGVRIKDVASETTRRSTLDTALTVGQVHILEYQNLDLSAWASFSVCGYGASTWSVDGAVYEVILLPAMSDADRTLIRSYLASKHGVTL